MNRGQAHTLEAIVGALLLLTSLVFALQVTAVTPLSASTSSQHIENQQQASAQGALAAAEKEGVLKPAVLYGNDGADGNDDGRFAFHEISASAQYYVNRAPRNGFGAILERTFAGRGLAYNVYVNYETSTGSARRRMVYQGDPSDNAVAAQSTVTLYDDDVLYVPADGDPDTFGAKRCDPADSSCSDLASAGDEFYAQDMASGRVFNVVEVEVVVWRQ